VSNSGRFSSDNQPVDRRPRGKNKRTLLLEALHEQLSGLVGYEDLAPEKAEEAFYGLMVRRSLTVADPASGQLLKEMLARLFPTDKATMPAIEFPFPENGSASQKIEAVQAAVASGTLPVDMGNTMVNMIVAGIKVFEVTELADRLARIEELLAKSDGD